MIKVDAIKNLLDISSESDGVIILAYSIEPNILNSIISCLKPPQKFRILCSAKTSFQRKLTIYKNLTKKVKLIEISASQDRFELAHAKLYLFCKSNKDRVDFKLILGSFNLTKETWRSIEIFGVYEFSISTKFLRENKVEHFIDILSLNKPPHFSLSSLKKHIQGEDEELGYEVLSLLFQLWFSNSRLLTQETTLEFVDYFGMEKGRKFVSTFGRNSLLKCLKDLLTSAFIYANEKREEVELTIVTPFHTQEGIETIISLIKDIQRKLNLNNELTIRLLTNSFKVSSNIDKSSFTNPSYLRRLMFNPSNSFKFKVKFWGHSPLNEDFIHAKLFLIKVAEKKIFMITSANLTVSGLGVGLSKNLEVGIVETDPKYTEKIYEWVEECWNSEYTIASEEDRIWDEFQIWYDRLEIIEEHIEEEFEIEGLKDFYIHEENVIKVRDKKNRKFKFIQLILSFSQKKIPIKNLEKKFMRRKDYFFVKFKLEKEEYIGRAICDIIAKLEDGSYIFIIQKMINILKRFPKIEMRVIPKIDAMDFFRNAVLPVEVKIEVGKKIQALELAKIRFELKCGNKKLFPKILLIREKVEKCNRLIQFLLYIEKFNPDFDSSLHFIYEDEKKCEFRISKEILIKIFKEVVSRKTTQFLEDWYIRLLTDHRTLCPRVKTKIKVNTNASIFKFLSVNELRVIRFFSYTELVGMEKIEEKRIREFQLKDEVMLDNEIEADPPVDVEAYFYGIKRDEWLILIPLGKLSYRLLKNPPLLRTNVKTKIKTNLSPINVEFNFNGFGVIDRMVFNIRIGKWEERFTSTMRNLVHKLPLTLSLEDIKSGMDLNFRFSFKYNVADIVGNVHIDYDYFISSPHKFDPSKTKMLIFYPKNPKNLLRKIEEEFPENFRPFISIIPIQSTNCRCFKLRLNQKTLKEFKNYFMEYDKGIFVLKKLDKEIIDQFCIEFSRNFADMSIHVTSCANKEVITLHFHVFYLEGIGEYTKAKEGQYCKYIVVYHPNVNGDKEDRFKKEVLKGLKEGILEILRKVHLKHLREKKEEIQTGKFWFKMHDELRKEVCEKIEEFIRKLKSEDSINIYKFKQRRLVPAGETRTFDDRRLIDFCLLIRKNLPELRIDISEV